VRVRFSPTTRICPGT